LRSVGPNARLIEDDLERAIRELKALLAGMALSRRREMAMRLSLGAHRRR
jgi:hypothetical protein